MNKDCVSLDVAKKLQDAGWRGKVENWWMKRILTGEWVLVPFFPATTALEFYPAPAAVQLAEELPEKISEGKYHLDIYKVEKDWYAEYVLITTWDEIYISKKTNTLTDALGLMMCYLLENKLI